MAGIFAAIAIASLAVSAGSYAYSSRLQEQANSQAKKQNRALLAIEERKMQQDKIKLKAEQAQVESESRRARIKELRAARISRASVLAAAQARGATGSTAVSGALANIGTGLAYNQAYSKQNVADRGSYLSGMLLNNQNIFSLSTKASMYGLKAQKANAQASMWAGIGSTAASTATSMGTKIT